MTIADAFPTTIADLLEKVGKFDESKHPRADDGKFGSGAGGAAKSKNADLAAQHVSHPVVDGMMRYWVESSSSRDALTLCAIANQLAGRPADSGQNDYKREMMQAIKTKPTPAQIKAYKAFQAQTAAAWDKNHPQGANLQRGIKGAELEILAKAKVGDSIGTMQALLSTTSDKTVASDFARTSDSGELTDAPGGIITFKAVRGAHIFASHESSPKLFEQFDQSETVVLGTASWTLTKKSVKAGITHFEFSSDKIEKAAKPATGVKGKFDESKHPRAKDGEFGSGGTGAAAKPKPGARTAAAPKIPKTSAKNVAAGAAAFQAPKLPGAMFAPGAGNVKAPKATTKLKPTPNRAFTGEPVALKTQLDKTATGRIGEGIAIAFLQQAGMTDARPANSTIPNFPVDVLGNTSCIEIKTGLVSNSKGAQQWRATIGEPGPKEKLLLAKMSPEKKKAWNAQKRQDIMDRKAAVIKAQGKLAGKTYKARTVTILINPDTRTADVHVMEGFHSRIGWTDARSKASYVGSFKYA